MTYQELTIFGKCIQIPHYPTQGQLTRYATGRLRKLNKLGPYAMFQRLVHDWSIDRKPTPGDDAPFYTPAQVAEKVKRFEHFYRINSKSYLHEKAHVTWY